MDVIEDILEQRMDRKEFLQYVGSGVTALLGVGLITKTVASLNKKTASRGYGASSYGGSKR